MINCFFFAFSATRFLTFSREMSRAVDSEIRLMLCAVLANDVVEVL